MTRWIWLGLLFYAAGTWAQLEEIQIKLVSPPSKKYTQVICEIDGNYFTVPRSMLNKKVTITAANGTKIWFPWQKDQCYDSEVYLR